MKEFTSYVKELLKDEGLNVLDLLPYEVLIDNFSNENGKELLSPWFKNVISKKVKSSLLFKFDDFLDFEKYFEFKRSFFIPGEAAEMESLSGILLDKVKHDLQRLGELKISKEDIFFVCTKPFHKVNE